ncbi:MAG: ABC transporter permease, partial [Desulfuromonadales bacterium]|nr:ABC transporter permease [Desulfuromonadales bacterium]
MLHRALRNMRQSPVLCSAAIGTVAVSLLLVAFFALIVLNVQRLTSQWSQEIQVLVYLDQVPEEKQLQGWISDLRQRPEVAEVTFVSQRQAFERFRQRLKQDADLLDGLDPDLLPASLELSLREEHRSKSGVEVLVTELKKNPSLADLRYGQDWLERFEAFVRLLQLAGAFLGAFLLFAALFIVANTIKLTLYARRDELEVMALVGATPLFIKAPFL